MEEPGISPTMTSSDTASVFRLMPYSKQQRLNKKATIRPMKTINGFVVPSVFTTAPPSVLTSQLPSGTKTIQETPPETKTIQETPPETKTINGFVVPSAFTSQLNPETPSETKTINGFVVPTTFTSKPKPYTPPETKTVNWSVVPSALASNLKPYTPPETKTINGFVVPSTFASKLKPYTPPETKTIPSETKTINGFVVPSTFTFKLTPYTPPETTPSETKTINGFVVPSTFASQLKPYTPPETTTIGPSQIKPYTPPVEKRIKLTMFEPLGMPTKLLNGFMVPATCSSEVLPLGVKNAHPRDTSIAFDEGPHVYYVEGAVGYTSTTTVAHENFEEFQADQIARQMVTRPDFRTLSRYAKYQKEAMLCTSDRDDDLIKAIIQSWDDNRDLQAKLGTAMHRYVELDMNNVPQEEDQETNDCKERRYYHDYATRQATLGYVPYRTEWMLWDNELKVTGSIDMIYFHPENKTYHMVDWKRSREIKRFGFKRGTGLCRHLLDCNYNHYSLQLNIYKYILEKNYDILISDMNIVVFHPNNDDYLEFEIANMQSLVHKLLTSR